MVKNNIPLSFSILLVLVACRKDPHYEELTPIIDTCSEEWCDEFPQPPEVGFQYSTEGIQYLAPCFNPNNSDEFIYIRLNSPTHAQLVKYNLITKQEAIILDPMSLGRPDWGRQGWITFEYSLEHVWKIYEDGTQLTQLTSGEDDRKPLFSFSGDEIFYHRQKNYSNFEINNNPELLKNSKMLVIDLSGNVIDSVVAESVQNDYSSYYIFQRWDDAVCSNDGAFYFMDGIDNLRWLCKFENDTVVKLRTWINFDGYTDIDIYGSYVYYTSHRNSLFKVNLLTGEETVLKIGCDTRYYSALSIAPVGEKILVQKVISTPYNNNYNIHQQNEIWLIDINGCGEERILGE